jgi:nucleoside phosphorylase/tetratricopeptide (TPR) repeat protein
VDAAELKGKVDFGIITIREDEFEAVLQRFHSKLGVVGGPRKYHLYRLELSPRETYTVALIRAAEHGNGEAKGAADAMLDDLAPRWLLVVGIGSGVPANEFTLGDVIASTRIHDFSVEAVLREHTRDDTAGGDGSLHPDVSGIVANLPSMEEELGAWNTEDAIGLARPAVDLSPQYLYGDPAWREKVRRSLEHHFKIKSGEARSPLVWTGAIASSDRLMEDDEPLRVWRRIARQVLVVEVESAGVYRAAHDRKVPFLAIRGISDVIGFERNAQWTAYACHSAAAFALAFLRSRPIPPYAGALSPRSLVSAAAPPGPFDRERRSEAGGSFDDARDAEAAGPMPAPLPDPPRCFGRDPLAALLVEAFLQSPPLPALILGPAGIGKSTLALCALHRSEVAERYGARRWFARLAAAPTADAALGIIARTMSLSPRGDALAEVRAELARAPSVLALDNVESPWERDREATEALLVALAAVPGLALLVSVRGTKRPSGITWRDAIRVAPLDSVAAAELFCSIAGASRKKDPALPSLLELTSGVPLAITLVAPVVPTDDLSDVVGEWLTEKASLLWREGAAAERLPTWSVALELSIGSTRMTSPAKRLAALLAALPDGIAEADLDKVFPGEPAAIPLLIELGIAYREGRRLTVFAPIREYLAESHPPGAADLERAMEHYGELARALGLKVGRSGGAEAVERLGSETANLDAMIRRGLAQGQGTRWIDVTILLTRFARFSARVLPSPLSAAREAARALGDVGREADCLQGLGDIALSRGKPGDAGVQYESALELYQQVGSVLGEASCLQALGDAALERQDDEQAKGRYAAALELYQRASYGFGEASCLQGLGDIAFYRSNGEAARERYRSALPLYRQVRDALGEANCLQGLGDVAFAQSDDEDARRWYEAAQPLYQQVGDTLGEANCVYRMGSIALRRASDEEARGFYDAALALYQQVGAALGEANCIQGLGDVALGRARQEDARARYEVALAIYERIADAYSVGMIGCRLARMASDPAEENRLVTLARRAWEQIDRSDLISRLEEEFGIEALEDD